LLCLELVAAMSMVTEVVKVADTSAVEPHGARDSALMARLTVGDETALGELHDLWCDAVHAFVVRSVHDDGDAEQIVEAVFVDAWLNAAMYCRASGSLREWLLLLASVRTVNFMHSARASLDAMPDREAHHDSADSAMTRASVGHPGAVPGALRRLPRVQRIALELACLDGSPLADIALRLGVPLHAARSHIRDALRAVSMLLTSPDGSSSRQSAPGAGS
jgi:RNA polymerase sigma-70 factor (ECF subfamily)